MKKIGFCKKKNLIMALLLLFVFLVGEVQTVFAGGWVDTTSEEYKQIYGTIGEEEDGKEQEEYEISYLEEGFSELFASFAKGINDILGKWNIDLSVEGIIYGRVGRGEGRGIEADITHFGLEANNPWGVAGATIFYNLRRLILSFMVIVLVVMLVVNLFKNTAKGRAEVKSLAEYTVLAFMLLFSMPYLLDAFIYVRDGSMYVMNSWIGSAYQSYGFDKNLNTYSNEEFNEESERNRALTMLRAYDTAMMEKAIEAGETGWNDVADFTSGTWVLDGYKNYEEYLQGRATIQVEIWRNAHAKNKQRGSGVFAMMYDIYYGNSDLSSTHIEADGGEYEGTSDGNPSLVNALLLLATAGAGFCFLGYYVMTALLLTGCFGLFPLVVLYGYWNRKIMQSWLDIMIPNMLVQFIDMLLLQIPIVVSCVYQAVYGAASLPLVLVLIFCYWAIIPVRTRILKLLGFDGIMGGRNGLIAAGAMALMRFGGGLFGGKRGGHGAVDGDKEGGTVKDYKDRALEESERQRVMEGADRGIASLPPLPETVQDASSSSYDSATNDFLERLQMQADEEALTPSLEELGEGQEFPEGYENFGAEADGAFLSAEEHGGTRIASGEGVDMDSDVVMSAEGDMVPGTDTADFVPLDDIPNAGMTEGRVLAQDAVGESLTVGATPAAMEEAYTAPPRLDADITGRTFSVPSANMDKEFADTLSDRDVGRYQNLSRLDAINDRLQSNEAFIRTSGYNRDTYTQDVAQLRDRNEALQGHISRLQKSTEGMDHSSAQYKDTMATIKDAKQAYGVGSKQLSNLERAASMDRERGFLNQHKERCETIEKQYAHNSGIGGMSDKRYATAADFKHQKQADAVKRMHMDYKNFDAKQYDGILSPQERSDYYRERATRVRQEQVRRVATTLAKVPVVASVATAGAFLGAAGGTTTSSAVVAMGGTLTSKGIDLAAKGVDALTGPAAKATYQKIKEGAPGQAKKAAATVSNAVNRAGEVKRDIVDELQSRANRVRTEHTSHTEQKNAVGEEMQKLLQQRADRVRDEFYDR